MSAGMAHPCCSLQHSLHSFPLHAGMLTGKYSLDDPSSLPGGPRGLVFRWGEGWVKPRRASGKVPHGMAWHGMPSFCSSAAICNLPSLPRRQVLPGLEPLLDLMGQIAQRRGKTLSQVAINWAICQV